MYWRIRHFPELDCLEPADREDVLRTVAVWTWLGMVGRAWAAGWLAAVPVMVVVAGLTPRGTRNEWMIGIGLAVTIVAGAGIYQVMLRRIRYTLRRELAAAFRGQPAPFCFRCGYDLRGLVHNPGAGVPRVCPECGDIDHASTRPASLSRHLGRFVGAAFKAFVG